MACGLLLEAGWEGVARLRTEREKGTAHVEDEVRLQVTLLPLLDEGRMRALLRETLKAAGWAETADGGLSKSEGGVTASLTPDGREVVIRASATVEVEGVGRAQGDDEDAAREAQRAAKADLARVTAQAQEGLRAKTLGEIAAAEPGLRAALQTALNRVYREALEEKARSMGEVESIQEKGDARGSYEVTITVQA
ncbi:MAG: hypothetical protein JNK72_01695 [Myxococcales bacterium]|nr:hypothetical protein [Myxococcales bacterium]